MRPRFTLQNTPLLLPALCYIAGIVAAEQLFFMAHIRISFRLTALLLTLFVLSAGAAIRLIRKHRRPGAHHTVPLSAILFCTVCALAGLLLTFANRTLPDIPVRHSGERLTQIVRIEEIPEKRPASRWMRVGSTLLTYADSLGSLDRDTLWQRVDSPERMWLYLDSTLYGSVHLGDMVQFRGRVWPGNDSVSGGYDRYMLRTRGITGRTYAWRVDRIASDTTLSDRIRSYRASLANRLTLREEGDPGAAGIIRALAIGDQSGIDRELRGHYSRTGVAHLLSVSGLHVGIVFMMLNLLLGWMRLFRRGIAAMGITVIVLLCGYAVLTGLSPSVLRAVLMFSMLQIGLMLSRHTNTLNTLCAAALVLLLWNPYYLYHIGFQLSFSAMVGIITLYRPLASLWKPRWGILRWFWSLTVVTLTAQIATLPLVMYHFNQLPLAAVLLNPFVWFTVPVIIAASLLFLATGWEWLHAIAQHVTGWQNTLVGWTASHRWIAVEQIELPLWVCVLCYAILTAGIIAVNRYGARRERFPYSADENED